MINVILFSPLYGSSTAEVGFQYTGNRGGQFTTLLDSKYTRNKNDYKQIGNLIYGDIEDEII